jgi:hypothetical protein
MSAESHEACRGPWIVDTAITSEHFETAEWDNTEV